MALNWWSQRAVPLQQMAPLVARGKWLAQLGSADFAAALAALRTSSAPANNPDEALALAVAAAIRSLDLQPFITQLYAAWHLNAGAICEMATGEGKSLAAALAAAAFALCGRHVHVVTVNAYLASRDLEQFTPLFEHCGLRAALLPADASVADKQHCYGADVVYGVGHDFGFDFLRDALAARAGDPPRLGGRWLAQVRGAPRSIVNVMQRTLDVALIDEVDSVLIDEARSALILSGTPRQPSRDARVYRWADGLVAQLRVGHDYLAQGQGRDVFLTEAGVARIAAALPAQLVFRRPWPRYVEQALRARQLLARDVDYMIGDDSIELIDEGTGRALPGRVWNDGLQQAVETKEGLTITEESQALVRIARQRFFQRYTTVCGLTGTARGLETEFARYFAAQVVAIPARLPSRRVQLPTRFFRDRAAKFAAVTAHTVGIHHRGRPILLGTRTIDDSEQLAADLRVAGVACEVLNARQDRDEADIIARAGQHGAVTVATNMAGRGTDIHLDPRVVASGGLHVVGVEHYEEGRLDRQLAGRAGRQGDPGSVQFFVAGDDPLLRIYAPRLSRRLSAARDAELGGIAARHLASAQARAAAKHAGLRQRLYDADYEMQKVLVALDDTC